MFRNHWLSNRKGELTTQQIVILIIVIISFIVLLYFLFLLNPKETSSKQICYNSVVLISKSSDLVGELDCKTNYLCISGGDSCTSFNPTITAKVDASKKDEVLKTIADEMADCWWMFGEGELNYLSAGLVEEGKEIIDSSNPYHCAICSKIKFDKKIQDKIKEITYSELADYMKTHQTSHKASSNYLKYLYGVNSLESSNAQIKEFDVNSVPISTSKDYLIITGKDPELLWGTEYKKVQLISVDDSLTKSECGIFDITQS